MSLILELDISPRVAVVDVETPDIDINPDASEAVGLVIAQGSPGAPGPQGPAGGAFDGVAWWYGQGPPGTIIGSKIGDYYLDTVSGLTYVLGA